MHSKIYFEKYFKNRMLVLAFLMACFIIFAMPLTYFLLSISSEAQQLQAKSDDLAIHLQELIRDNPELWEYNMQKLTKVLTEYNNQGISSISIYDNYSNLIYENKITEPTLFEQSKQSQIFYNNKIFGYINITSGSNALLFRSFVLFMFCIFLGIIAGILLYKFPASIVSKAQDEIVTAFEKLNTLSYYDHLTALPNRTKFNDQLLKTLASAKIRKKKVAVMFLDLDRFKVINDTMGHTAGDTVLRAVAIRLNSGLRTSDILARHSGDEFTVVVPNIENSSDAAEIAQRLIQAFDEPFSINNQELHLSTSVGISMFPEDCTSPESLIKFADLAMYKAKEQGSNKFVFYATEFSSACDEKFELENELRNALKNNEFILHYQPITNILTGKIEGYEALIRWNHPKRGLLYPASFIPIAEETGLINEIGMWVLETACRQNQDWISKGLFPKYVSVNISMKQFKQPKLVQNIKKVLGVTGLNPKYLQLEITESVSMFDEKRTIAILNALKHLGTSIAIDDFGTGYSSLNYLKHFPMSVIKIDKGFIENMLSNPHDAAAVGFIIQMAHSLNLRVIAEGVETEGQFTHLRKNFCNDIQGYYISRPLPKDELEKLLKSEEEMWILPDKNRFTALVQSI